MPEGGEGGPFWPCSVTPIRARLAQRPDTHASQSERTAPGLALTRDRKTSFSTDIQRLLASLDGASNQVSKDDASTKVTSHSLDPRIRRNPLHTNSTSTNGSYRACR